MYIEIQPNFIERAYVMIYNASCIDYSLVLETDSDSIDISRISKKDLFIIKKAIDTFIEKEGLKE